MKVSSVAVTSYKSIRSLGSIELSPRMTVVVGQNHSGKSALLECIARLGGSAPHRSKRSVPYPRHQPETSRVGFSLTGTGADVHDWVDSHPDQDFTIRLTSGARNFATGALEKLLTTDRVHFINDTTTWVEGPYMGVSEWPEGTRWARFRCGLSGSRPVWNGDLDGSAQLDLREQLRADHVQHGTLYLNAERPVVGATQVNGVRRLSHNADNLPSVLGAILSTDVGRFMAIRDAVRAILPSVKHLQVPHAGAGNCEVVVWPDEERDGRPDLAVPLSAAGTGVAQVLAVATLLLSAATPMVVVLDEPNSFLHPGAVTALLSLFAGHPQHQYVLATHSADVVTEAEPERVYRTELVDGETRVEAISPSDVHGQRRILIDLGQRLSAFFGAERILWVEGPTEEQVFTRVLRAYSPDLLRGLRIIGVVDTGVFQRRDVARVAKIYDKVAAGYALLPPTVGFVLDREQRSVEEREALQALVSKPLVFTRRRMTESYLIHPRAIAHVLAEHVGHDVPPSKVEDALKELADNRAYGATAARVEADEWIASVDAARLLKDLFARCDDTKPSYDKATHSLAIASWLLANERESLRPLADELGDVISGRAADRVVQKETKA